MAKNSQRLMLAVSRQVSRSKEVQSLTTPHPCSRATEWLLQQFFLLGASEKVKYVMVATLAKLLWEILPRPCQRSTCLVYVYYLISMICKHTRQDGNMATFRYAVSIHQTTSGEYLVNEMHNAPAC